MAGWAAGGGFGHPVPAKAHSFFYWAPTHKHTHATYYTQRESRERHEGWVKTQTHNVSPRMEREKGMELTHTRLGSWRTG